ncbi:MAG: iron-containing redox enzyme family protein [Opitutaceae bacterium]|nr:iron-containing redox enzyme family protein [Opitutaceae bacterium]
MSFYQQLQESTEAERQQLFASEMITRSLNGDIDLDDYVSFLSQAYHHVKHTVPLMMAAGSRLPDEKEWLRTAIAEYIKEEIGHQEWILNDISNCGFDKEIVRNSTPHFATELMVSYAYDMVSRVNPVGFFGMVLVLEGTSVSLADMAASGVKNALDLSERSFSYLRSHGSIDQEHIQFLETLLNKFESPQDQQLITHSAKAFYRLYQGVFESIKR